MKTKIWITLILVVVVLGGGVWYLSNIPDKPGKLDAFAQCINDSGAKFYGAFWCSHCQAQKAMFGKSVSLLPYVECSLPSGSGQTQICNDQKIEGYPTWIFKDGSRLTGEIPLATLAEKTNCTLPQ